MRRHISLICASAITGIASAAHAQSAEEPFIAEFRVENGASLEAMAWRVGDDILVSPDTVRALGLSLPEGETQARISLGDLPGARVTFLASEQAVLISCSALCFPSRTVQAGPLDTAPLALDSGAFLGMDLVASQVGGADMLAGAFDFGIFHNAQHGGTSWTMGALGDDTLVRLDTVWNIDFPDARLRLRLGDSIAPASGAAGAPFRFGGVQFGTDFSLDPTFVRFPAPTLRGEAQTPSVVELYVEGALRTREAVDAGPFEIVDAPVVAGAGLAQVVVTDALGRQTRINAPFYASPRLLRAGLEEFALLAGAEREQYALESAAYGRAFMLGAYRRGLTNWITGETRLELSQDLTTAGGAFSLAGARFGQLDAGLSVSDGELGTDALMTVGWSHLGDTTSLAFQYDAAGADYRRLGQRDSLPAEEARATLAVELGVAGAVALTGAAGESQDGERVTTLGLSYAPPPDVLGAFSFSALYVDDGDPFVSVGLSFVRPFGDRGSIGGSVVADDGDVSVMARAQAVAPPHGGFGWRAQVSEGAIERADVGVQYRAEQFDARFEASRTPHADGLRGQFTSAIVLMGGSLTWARNVRDSFALVQVGVPDVDVYRDRLHVGRTDASGRLFVPGLRAYETNRISIDVEDLPIDAFVAGDELAVRPASRSGAVVRFAVSSGGSGELVVVDQDGAPLPTGTILSRDTDQARFPVGGGGRIYLYDVDETATLTADSAGRCQVVVRPAALAQDEPLRCIAVTGA